MMHEIKVVLTRTSDEKVSGGSIIIQNLVQATACGKLKFS